MEGSRPTLHLGVMQWVEAMCTLSYSAVYAYKERYRSETPVREKAVCMEEFTSGLSALGIWLKKVTRKRFKVVGGAKHFDVHKGEWARTDTPPADPCNVYKAKG